MRLQGFCLGRTSEARLDSTRLDSILLVSILLVCTHCLGGDFKYATDTLQRYVETDWS